MTSQERNAALALLATGMSPVKTWLHLRTKLGEHIKLPAIINLDMQRRAAHANDD